MSRIQDDVARCFPAELVVATPGTAVGGDTLFAQPVRYVHVHATKDTFIGKATADLSADPAGVEDKRRFVPAGATRVMAWMEGGRGDRRFHAVNAVGGETPAIYVEGWI